MSLEPGNKLLSTGIHGEEGTYGYMYWCPGCKGPHHVPVRAHEKYPRPVWGWNGSTERPTFTPSILVHGSAVSPRCHVFVTDGRIQFLSDCTHELAGQTVDIPDWPKDKDW